MYNIIEVISLKKFYLIITIIFVLAISISCKNKTNDTINKEDIKQNLEITYFYPTEDFIVLGKEDNAYLKIKSTIDGKDDKNFLSIVDNLQNPTNLTNEKVYPSISKDIKINSITLDDDVFIVDFDSKNLSGGSLDEEILINSLVQTLLSIKNNSPLGKYVKFTVDNLQTQSLFGHFQADKLYSLDNIK